MGRRKPWQRAGGDVRAVDQAARNQALCAELAEVRAKLAATEAQLRWHKAELANAAKARAVAVERAADLGLDVDVLTAQLEQERERHADTCSHAAEARDLRRTTHEQAARIEQLQMANEARDSAGWAVRS